MTLRHRALGLASALCAVLLGACACGPDKGVLGAPGGKPWPFSPPQARVVMLMDRGHASTRGGRQLWAVTQDLTYTTHAGDRITIPKGFVTDLASIPAVFQSLLPSDGPYAQPAVVHDVLFRTSGSCVLVWTGKLPDGKPFRKVGPKTCSRAAPYTRAESNAILDQAMADIGVSAWRRWLIMDGLYVGSWAAWGH